MFDNMVHEDFRIIQLDRSGDGANDAVLRLNNAGNPC
jgi:hypothetical protein